MVDWRFDKREDFNEYLFVFIISLLLIVIFISTPLNELFHETGHAVICSMQGGEYTITENTYAHVTSCRNIEWTQLEALNFYMAGMGFEFLLGILLLLVPLISILGALMILNTNLNLIMGYYSTDIVKASEILPFFNSLNSPVIQIILLFFSMILIGLSFYYTKKMVEKLDIPFI